MFAGASKLTAERSCKAVQEPTLHHSHIEWNISGAGLTIAGLQSFMQLLTARR
jgi:hypothetical protein